MKIFLNIEHLKNFPSTFIEFATTEPEPDIEPWWLLIYQEVKINYWHNTLKNLYPNRTLVPFAKFNANDDIACFDGDDLSGNPKVLIIHAYASEGWELHGEHPDFSAWLKIAIETHAEWNKEDLKHPLPTSYRCIQFSLDSAMIFSIDITECFGAIDSDNAGGIISCISIPPIENPQEKFRLKLSNFVLNLIDEPVIESINRQNSTFLKNMTEDGFLIIRQASISFDSIKGYEKLLRLLNQDHGYLTHERYGQKLNTGDKIYDISGRLFSNPELLINFAFISPSTITLKFNSSDCTYIESYPELQKSLEKLNSRGKPTQPPLTGLFDPTYSNTHTTSNFGAGYRVYNQ